MRLTTSGVALLLLVLYANNPSDAWTHNWHTGPINCYNCTDAADCAAGAGRLRKCEGNDAQSCVAVFASNGSVIERGCSDILESTCSTQECYECRSHGCNNLTSNAQLIECVSCDAASDENCYYDYELVTETRQCHGHCITALYPRTSDAGAPLELVRTCLDDLDLDDREACAEGTLANCAACSTAKCNTVEIGTHGSCNVCSGTADCANPQSKTCRAVAANGQQEQCFIQLDEAGEVAEQGCLSQYNVSDVATLQSEKRLWLCTGKNCNVISALPAPQECILCSSRTEKNCSIAPADTETFTTCSNTLNTDCYALLRDDGNTERGCLTTLDSDDYLECLNGGNATKCVTCHGEKCNVELQPADRLSCHICDSSEDDNCEISPDASALCLLHSRSQQCVTTIDLEGNTLRGCSDSLKCIDGSARNCQLCEGNNCNTVNLRRSEDGQPGQWGQELPLSCQSCNDTSACAASDPTVISCSDSSDYCMTIFNDAGQVQARGCSSVVESSYSDYCDANSNNCRNCNSNGCNNATTTSSYSQCIYCESSINGDCIADADKVTTRRQCNGQCMTALRPKSGSNVYDIVRGCLDDKDPEDQELCAAGSDSQCRSCSGDACNVDVLEVDSLSCYVCNAEDGCEEEVQAVCLHYSPTDRCYSLYDETASVTAKGCLSDLDESFVDENLEYLHLCSGNNCNSYDNIPKPNRCAVCSSLEDENCAVEPDQVTDYTTCQMLPNTGCMTRVLSDGSTERGCLASLASSDLRSCLKGESGCEICEGELCNQQIYPADRRRCQRCNSRDDPNCASAPSAVSACPRYNETDGCSVKLVNGATYRGCQSEFTCDDKDKQYCRLCASGDNCNVVDLNLWNIGYPGKWTTPPINCYTCQGAACQGSSLGVLQKCAGNDEQNCATVFASNGSVVLRGCTDTLYADAEQVQYCDENSGNCKFCKSSGCNNARSLDVYVDCVLCDGSDQASCVRSVGDISRQTSCQASCFTGLYARSSNDVNSALELARGCLDDLEYDDREACAAGNLENCVACTGAACNKDAVPENRLSCNYCDDASCDNVTPQICTAYRSNDQCYIHVGDLKIESMGCASDLESTFLLTNRRDLHLCSGDNCNTKDVLKAGVACNLCNSTSDANCIAGPFSLSAVCQHYLHPECITHITSDGVVHRGCLMDTDDELFDDCASGTSGTCEICDTNGCNKDLYPSDWQTCLRCDSSSDANCEKTPSGYASYCPSYAAGDGCVTSLEKGRTRRGCQSELYCDANQPTSCRNCAGENCNSIDLAAAYVGEPGKWQDLPLSCHVCSDLASCASVTSTPSTCEGNNKQLCSTVFNADGQVIARGCSDSVLAQNADYCEANDAKCPKCKSNGCNNATSLDSYVQCYFCDADEDASCAWETPTRTRLCQGQCMTGLYPRSSSWDSALLPTRGCLDDLELAERELCAAGNHANCTASSGALSNGGDIIANPQECYVCVSQDCEDIATAKCVAYREQDQCYTAFDENTVIAMGCASDFETQVLNELVAQKRISLCTGPNCNNLNNIPNPTNCLECSSLNDTRCASNPNQLLTSNICQELPYTQCVTHIDAAGTTRRGCLSSLASEDFYGCLTGSAEHCEICEGNNCNGLSVYPSDRRSCHQCDSATNPACATSTPSSSSVCHIYDAADTCVTTYRNEVTYRGCSSSLSCDDASDASTCRICSEQNCNTVDLERINVHGYPGLWQPTPISCLTCDSSTSCAAGAGTLQQCEGINNCVTVFDASGETVTSRGCFNALDTSAASYCDEQPENCPRCNSNGCNIANRLDEYVDCVVCDSSENPNCVQDVSQVSKTRSCRKACMTAFRNVFNESSSSDPSYALVRNCYDDLEAEDREACEAGSRPYCATCEEEKCNTQDLVSDRHSCWSCRGDECQDPLAVSCANYREADQCFIEFDEQRSVVAQGCLSEYSNADIYLLQRSKRLWTCKEKDCNTLDALPEEQSCVLCSSRTDRYCAISPGSVSSATSCQWTGLPECYSRVLADGSTERGCLSSLEDDEFLGCYNGTASGCAACLGDSCNNQVYPDDRASCHICNSEADPNCATEPSSLTVCPIFAPADTCVTNLRNGITYRSCGSSLSCEPNSKSCVYCSGDGCNVADLSQLDDDNHGKWQDLPLSCLSCSDAASCQQETLPSELCAGNNEQDCVTVFDASGAVVARGCEDAIDADDQLASYCATSRASCPVCKSNDCNNATTTTQYQSCIYCDSFKNSSCLWDPESSVHKRRQCQGQCMTALYGSSEAGLDLIRTCLDDKEPADQLTCLSGSDSNCAACSGADCNVQSLPADRHSCYHCTDGDCEDPQTRLCDVYKPNDSCFIWVDEQNSIKELGCLSSFRNQDLESVIKTRRIAVCEGENCNTPQLQGSVKCAVCDSRVDPSCAISPLAVETFEICTQLPHTYCVTRLESDGATTRGCLYDLPQADFAACLLGNDTNCELCREDGCNRGIFPADRLLCYSCSSADDSTCESDPSRTSACLWVNDEETCQTSLANNVTTRGCSSSVACDGNDYRNCRSCNGSECNAIDLANRVDDGQHGLFQTLPLKCHTCEGEHCLASLGPSTQCTLNPEQDCKTVFNLDGQTVRRRGCADDVDDYEDRYCRHHPELCFVCKSNECNDAWELTDYTSCVYCNSETDDQCVTYPQSAELGTRQCQGKCLVALLDNKELLRSCLDDKELYDQSACSSDESGSSCAACTDGNCNTFAYPADRLSCHVCTGSDCSSSRSESCRAYDQQDFCFAKYNGQGGVQLMGCASGQNSSDLEAWRSSNTLYECSGKDCNELRYLPESELCVSCDSSKTPDCAQSPTDVSIFVTCHAPLASCVTRLENGNTIRGCLSELSSSEGAACVANGSCASCDGEKCNTEIFPANRRRCHICNSSADEQCNEQPNHLAICPIYAADDTCVSSYGSDQYLQRGCGSQLECVINDEDHCQVCNTDGCNTVTFSGSASLHALGLALPLLLSLLISCCRW